MACRAAMAPQNGPFGTDPPVAAAPKHGKPASNRSDARRHLPAQRPDQDDSESCTHVVWGGVECMSSNSSDHTQSQGSCVEAQTKADRNGVFSGVRLRRYSTSSGSDQCVEAPKRTEGYPQSSAAGNAMMYANAPFPDMGALLDEVDSPEVTAPADQRSGAWSEGAVLHESGNCKPCARSWKPRGCIQGASCPCCHTCGIDEFKRYRKNRLAGLRANRAKRKNKNSAMEDPAQGMLHPGLGSHSL